MRTSFLRFWPGVSGLLRHGRWSFLLIALGFALVFDALLVANFYWTELLSREWKYYSAGLLLLVWFLLYSCGRYVERKIELVDGSDRKRNFFGDAVTQYLQGNWFQAECFLNEVLKRNPRDVESLLMLGTLLRHTGRYEESRRTLTALQKLEGAGKWYFEIFTELRFLEEALAPKDEQNAPADGVPPDSPVV